MAKKKGKSKRSQRVNSYNSKKRDLLRSPKRKHLKNQIVTDDRRYFNPDNYLRKMENGLIARIMTHDAIDKSKQFRKNKGNWKFVNPRKTITCMRRRARRIALFASGRVGKGTRVSRIRKRHPDSDIRCDRR